MSRGRKTPFARSRRKAGNLSSLPDYAARPLLRETTAGADALAEIRRSKWAKEYPQIVEQVSKVRLCSPDIVTAELYYVLAGQERSQHKDCKASLILTGNEKYIEVLSKARHLSAYEDNFDSIGSIRSLLNDHKLKVFTALSIYCFTQGLLEVEDYIHNNEAKLIIRVTAFDNEVTARMFDTWYAKAIEVGLVLEWEDLG